MDQDAKYLGNNFFLSNQRKYDFDLIKRKIITCFEGWKVKLLSQTGRKTLVKHVITSILLYYMTIVKIPLGIYDEVEKLSRTFLWRGDVNEKKQWVPVAWNNICEPKFCGGLGIKRVL